MVATNKPEVILQRLRELSGFTKPRVPSLDRDDLVAQGRLLDPPIRQSELAEAAGVTVGAITGAMRREERRRGLESGALSKVRATAKPAS